MDPFRSPDAGWYSSGRCICGTSSRGCCITAIGSSEERIDLLSERRPTEPQVLQRAHTYSKMNAFAMRTIDFNNVDLAASKRCTLLDTNRHVADRGKKAAQRHGDDP